MKARLVDVNGNLVMEEELKGVDVYPDVIRFRHRTFAINKASLMSFQSRNFVIYTEASVYWISHG
jgi:hypothetical protein